MKKLMLIDLKINYLDYILSMFVLGIFLLFLGNGPSNSISLLIYLILRTSQTNIMLFDSSLIYTLPVSRRNMLLFRFLKIGLTFGVMMVCICIGLFTVGRINNAPIYAFNILNILMAMNALTSFQIHNKFHNWLAFCVVSGIVMVIPSWINESFIFILSPYIKVTGIIFVISAVAMVCDTRLLGKERRKLDEDYCNTR